MAALAGNLTPTYWLKYTSEKVQHELEFRLGAGSGSTAGSDAAVALANVLRALLPTTDAFIGLRWRQAGSNLSFNIGWTIVPGTNSTPVPNGAEPAFWSTTGRSADGRRCRMTFFNPYGLNDENYRKLATEDTVANAWLGVLTGGVHPFVSVSGGSVIWNPYVNTGYNSYFQRKKRRTG